VVVPIEVSWRGRDGMAVKEDAVARQVNAYRKCVTWVLLAEEAFYNNTVTPALSPNTTIDSSPEEGLEANSRSLSIRMIGYPSFPFWVLLVTGILVATGG
jgi:hypothetical protein